MPKSVLVQPGPPLRRQGKPGSKARGGWQPRKPFLALESRWRCRAAANWCFLGIKFKANPAKPTLTHFILRTPEGETVFVTICFDIAATNRNIRCDNVPWNNSAEKFCECAGECSAIAGTRQFLTAHAQGQSSINALVALHCHIRPADRSRSTTTQPLRHCLQRDSWRHSTASKTLCRILPALGITKISHERY